jgi:molybdate transport system regulatory protein
MRRMKARVQFRLRIYRDDIAAIGPGKVALLESIAEQGSISGAARQLGMSYRRAWMLIEELNSALVQPAVATATGGAKGGGARLTPVGEKIIRHYRAIEISAKLAASEDVAQLTGLLAP